MRCRVSVGLWAPSTHAGHAFGRQVWHLGIYKDKKSLLPVEYYNKLPKRVTVNTVYVLDPMPISGATAVAAIDILKVRGRGGDGGVTARAPRPFAGWSLHLRSLPAPRSPSPHIPHHPTPHHLHDGHCVCALPSLPPTAAHPPPSAQAWGGHLKTKFQIKFICIVASESVRQPTTHAHARASADPPHGRAFVANPRQSPRAMSVPPSIGPSSRSDPPPNIKHTASARVRTGPSRHRMLRSRHCPQAINFVCSSHPDVMVHVGCIDKETDASGAPPRGPIPL